MKRAEHQPTMASLTLFAGIFMKTWTVRERGTLLPQHSHTHPHISYIVSGVVRVWRGDEMLGDFAAPAAIKIAAQVLHAFLTMTDNAIICCIHNADHIEGDEPAVAQHASLELED